MDLVTFDTLADAPVHYARQPVAAYGTIGKRHKCRLGVEFKHDLEVCLRHAWATCPDGKPEAFVTAGCYVVKAGRHAEGRAIDIDSLWWRDSSLVAKNAPKNARKYLALESVFRMYFGVVLGFWYNHAHEDHWHIDNGHPQGWRDGSRSLTTYLQAALCFVHERDYVAIDGVCGAKTRRAFSEVMGGDNIRGQWDGFLIATRDVGFSTP